MGSSKKFDISKISSDNRMGAYLPNKATYMAPWKIIATKEYEALKDEVKGYYGQIEDTNAYLKAISSQMQHLRLPDISVLSREQIKRVYETSAPVMGVVNYIAENVGEVATYLELTKNGEPVEKHPVLDTLRRPNDRYNLRKFVTAWAVNRLLFGDAWTYVVKTVGKEGKVNLYVIPSQRVVQKDGEAMFEGIKLYGVSSSPTIKMTDVFESFDYNLDDTSIFGTSKVVAWIRACAGRTAPSKQEEQHISSLRSRTTQARCFHSIWQRRRSWQTGRIASAKNASSSSR